VHTLTRLTVTESKLFLREPAGVFFTLAFPPLVLVVLGLVPPFREPSADLGGARMIDLYVPILLTMAITLLALNGLPQLFATYREKGILRRLATTPVRPAKLLGAQLLMCTAMAVLVLVVVLAVGRLGFDVALPRQIPAYLLAYVLCVVSMLAIGLLIASLAPNGRGAGAIGSMLFFPALFFAGLWLPREVMWAALRRVSDFTPLGAGVQSLSDAAAGRWPALLAVAVMLGWTVVAGGLAARYFRWE
jgi:ABC-2 type transport system permease protein